ncbi:hypothetical protein ABE458_23800 [Pseudomonas protegens]|uniref:hypothetical protein n=1 Tax=Pseudomonas protegens TaxID=380021 RepID=UPI00320A4B77
MDSSYESILNGQSIKSLLVRLDKWPSSFRVIEANGDLIEADLRPLKQVWLSAAATALQKAEVQLVNQTKRSQNKRAKKSCLRWQQEKKHALYAQYCS